MSAGPPDPTRALGLIRNARMILIGSDLLLYFLNHDGHFSNLQRELFPIDDHSLELGRHDGTMYSIKTYGPLVKQLRANPTFNLEYLGIVLQSLLMNIGDELARNRYFAKSPELEFFRHIRNALGHGNRFHFKGKEPVLPATLRGRNLSRDLHGQQVFFQYMNIGDVFDLLDDLESQLVANHQ